MDTGSSIFIPLHCEFYVLIVSSPHPEQDHARLQGQHQPPPQADLRHAEGSLRQGAPPPQG